MAKVIQAYDNLAEIWSTDDCGSTGRFAEVIRGQVQDAGGNVLFEGSAARCRIASKKYRWPVTLVPTEWNDVGEDAITDRSLWQLVTEKEKHGKTG